jgi:cell division control protein 45
LFTHPGALTKLALWVGEAILQQEKASGGREGKKGMPLVLAGMNKPRGIYVVVGTGGGGGVIDFAARKAREEKRKEKIKKKEEKAAEKERERAEKAEREGAEDEDEAEEEEESEDGDDSEDDSDDERTHERGFGKNRFGNAFQEVVDETNARVRIDSFEHCVVEVKIDDFSGFLESLSAKTVVG